MPDDTRARPKAEIGTTGLKRWAGSIQEDYLAELQGVRGVRAYDELCRNDPLVNWAGARFASFAGFRAATGHEQTGRGGPC